MKGSEFFHAEMLDPGDAGDGRGARRERSVIPAGIFLLLFFIEACIAAGASAAYFMYVGATGIGEIESYVRSYSLAAAEAFAVEGGATLGKKNHPGLRSLFRDKMGEGLIDEAFFVLTDGSTVVREGKTAEPEPAAGGAAVGWTHSPELILAPVRRRSVATIISDYFVPSKPIPVREELRPLLRRHLYPGIDSNTWLVTRAVFSKKEPAGAVGFIVGKQKIYAFIEAHGRETLRVFLAGLGVAFLISLAVSFVVFLRYRSLRRGPARAGARDEFYDMTPAAAPGREPRNASAPSPGGGTFGRSSGIRDAIPVRGKE